MAGASQILKLMHSFKVKGNGDLQAMVFFNTESGWCLGHVAMGGDGSRCNSNVSEAFRVVPSRVKDHLQADGFSVI